MIGDIWNFYAINFSQHLLARPNVFVLVANFKKSRHATSKLAILLSSHDSVARPKGPYTKENKKTKSLQTTIRFSIKPIPQNGLVSSISSISNFSRGQALQKF